MKLRIHLVTLTLAVAAASSVTLLSSPAQAADGACAKVEIRNVRPEQGSLWIAAYADAEGFGKAPSVGMQLKAGAETMTFALCGLAGPVVALQVFQDLNDNGKLDRNAFGMPNEPWGASGTPAAMAAPTWALTNVPLDGKTIVVSLSK